VDLLTFVRTLWRHRWWSVPLLAVTIAGVVYVAVASERVYEARADLVLIGPPGPPTAAELEADPALASARLDNPYARAFDPTVITEIVARVVASDRDRGNIPGGYRIDTARRYGSSAPLIEISARAGDPDVAVDQARIVSDRFVAALASIQAVENVHPRSLITTRVVDAAEGPREIVTQRLRAILGVAALGAIIVLVAVTLAQAIAEQRMRRRLASIDPFGPEPGGSTAVKQATPTASRT
jgi:capsular polysaccharide biosynthesis protein